MATATQGWTMELPMEITMPMEPTQVQHDSLAPGCVSCAQWDKSAIDAHCNSKGLRVMFCLAGNGNGNNNVGLVNGIGNGNFNGAGTLKTSSPCHLHSAAC